MSEVGRERGVGQTFGPIGVHVSWVPTAYRLHHSFPNPFNPICSIRYDIPVEGRVSFFPLISAPDCGIFISQRGGDGPS